jgi:VanZ family protein
MYIFIMLLIKYWKSILMTLVILVLSFAKLPSMGSMSKAIPFDKIAHFFMYLILTIILMYEFTNDTKSNLRNNMFFYICVLYPFLLGAITEVIQTLFFYPRIAEWGDLISNTGGIFIGWGVFLLFKRKIKT